MADGRKTKRRAEETGEDPPSSDSDSEMGDGFDLVNQKVTEDGHRFGYYRLKPTKYQAAMMGAKETWANFSVETVQQAIGAVASELTDKASGLSIAATANVTMEPAQHSVGTAALRMAKVASRIAYQTASRVADLMMPIEPSFDEDRINGKYQETSPRKQIVIAQQIQASFGDWEPLMKATEQELAREKRKATQMDEWLDRIPPDKDADIVAGRKHSIHPGPVDRFQGVSSVEHHSEGYGPKFTIDENYYDTLGVSDAWQNPSRESTREDRRKSLLEEWNKQESRSARDGTFLC